MNNIYENAAGDFSAFPNFSIENSSEKYVIQKFCHDLHSASKPYPLIEVWLCFAVATDLVGIVEIPVKFLPFTLCPSSLLHQPFSPLRRPIPRNIHSITMFRSVAIRACRAFSTITVTTRISPPIVAPSILGPQFARPSTVAKAILGARYYSAPASLSKQEVESRIIDLLKDFDKVSPLSLSIFKYVIQY